MGDEKNLYILKLVRRPWYEWLLFALWLFAEIVFLQAAIESKNELEPRAAMLYWLVFIGTLSV